MTEADRLLIEQLMVVAANCSETGLNTGAGVMANATAQLTELWAQLDYYERNVKARREVGDLSSLACLYCEYVEGTLKKQCPTHAELAKLQAERDALAAQIPLLIDDLACAIRAGGLRFLCSKCGTWTDGGGPSYPVSRHWGNCDGELQEISSDKLEQIIAEKVSTRPTSREVERVKALEQVVAAARQIKRSDGCNGTWPAFDTLILALAALYKLKGGE